MLAGYEYTGRMGTLWQDVISAERILVIERCTESSIAFCFTNRPQMFMKEKNPRA